MCGGRSGIRGTYSWSLSNILKYSSIKEKVISTIMFLKDTFETYFYPQVDGTISHHDMFDYLSLTQKGYSKAFDPVNELLTQLLQEMEGEVGRTEAEGSAD